jgi:hypothetical protein
MTTITPRYQNDEFKSRCSGGRCRCREKEEAVEQPTQQPEETTEQIEETDSAAVRGWLVMRTRFYCISERIEVGHSDVFKTAQEARNFIMESLATDEGVCFAEEMADVVQQMQAGSSVVRYRRSDQCVKIYCLVNPGIDPALVGVTKAEVEELLMDQFKTKAQAVLDRLQRKQTQSVEEMLEPYIQQFACCWNTFLERDHKMFASVYVFAEHAKIVVVFTPIPRYARVGNMYVDMCAHAGTESFHQHGPAAVWEEARHQKCFLDVSDDAVIVVKPQDGGCWNKAQATADAAETIQKRVKETVPESWKGWLRKN